MYSAFVKKQIVLIYLLLTIATLLTFWQVSHCDFISYDDPLYVTENAHIMNGLTVDSVRWAFTSTYANFWHPLTLMSLMLDNELFGLTPRWYHLTNLLFHVANTLLLFFVLNRMTKSPWKSAFVAALFALHPLHVESVAWIAERKDVLSTFFWMLTLIAYVHYVEHPRLKSYLAVLVFFIMGLMAKPMLVTLPFVMLLLDYWPLQRFGQKTVALEVKAGPDKSVFVNKKKAKSGKKPSLQNIVKSARPVEHKCGWAETRRLLIEKIPLFVLVPLFSVLTYIAEGEAVINFPWNVRVRNALVSYVIYIGKTVWPTGLAVFYPHPGLLPLWQAMGAALLLAAVTAAVILAAKRFPYLAIGWLWFAGTLAPVIGIVQIGSFGRADRFTYIPLIGLFIMVAWGVPELLKGWRYRREALAASSTLIVCSLSIAAWIQAGYWRDSITLYDHTLKVTDHNAIIYTNRGITYSKLGNFQQAIADFDRAMQINPGIAVAYYNRGAAYGQLGNFQQAVSDYNRAIEINPEYANAYNSRGVAYRKLGDLRQALSDYNRAIDIDPEHAEARNNRGVAQGALGNRGQAISDLDRAIEINPKYAEAFKNRGVVHDELGDHRQAISDYDRAIEIDPEYAEAYTDRGAAYRQLGNLQQAISDFNRTIQINPGFAVAYYNRGIACGQLGDLQEAISDYNKAIEINAEYAGAYINRGVVYGKLGNLQQAISDYDKAIEINPEYAGAYINRGIAYGKLGNREEAIENLKKAARLGSEDAKNLLKGQGMDW